MTTPTTPSLYLDLLKKALTFSLWEEPPLSIDHPIFESRRFGYRASSRLSALLRRYGVQIVKQRRSTEQQRREGRVWPGYADTMIGWDRLNNIQACIETVLKEKIPGDFVELGVWRGGACIFMRGALAAYGVTDRRVFVADSFAGLPDPQAERYASDRGDKHSTHSYLAVSEDDVRRNFERYGLLDDQVVFLKGWFEDTLPTAPIRRLSLMRLDGDMYSSTIQSLENLYSRLSVGGFCLIDDYALKGCRAAVDDFRAANEIKDELKEVDWTGRYWRKSAETNGPRRNGHAD